MALGPVSQITGFFRMASSVVQDDVVTSDFFLVTTDSPLTIG